MNDMIKVLFLIPDLSYGGAEKVLVNLANNMDKSKFDVTIQTLFDVGVHRSKIAPSVHYIPGFKHQFRGNSHVMKLFSPKFLFKHIVHENYDLVVSFLEGPPARIVSGFNGKKVAWIHIEQKTKKLVSASFRNFAEAEKCYNQFDGIVCVADTIRKDFTSLIALQIPVDVLYNVNETQLIAQMATEQQNKIQNSIHYFNIISVGRLSCHHKGFDRLIHIHKKLIDNHIQNKLYILGEGQDRDLLTSLIEKLGVADSCFLLGFHENPYKYVKNADLFICSSHREGFSTAVSEALIVGTPVVSTHVSGATELLGEHNEYGIVCENSEEALYNAVSDLLTNPEKLKHYKQQAKIRGAKFSTDETVRAVENYFEKIVNEY